VSCLLFTESEMKLLLFVGKLLLYIYEFVIGKRGHLDGPDMILHLR